MRIIDGNAYLKEAEFVGGIWRTNNYGLHISHIHISTCDSDSFMVISMSVYMLQMIAIPVIGIKVYVQRSEDF